MSSSIDALGIRARLGRRIFAPPVPFGPDGWMFDSHGVGPLGEQLVVVRVIVTCAEVDGDEWVHASISRPDEMPTYEDLAWLHRAVWPGGHAAQLFVPADEHVNIATYALHLWGRPDGRRLLPNFGRFGTI